MKAVERIKLPIKDEMELFEQKFSGMMKSHIPLLDRVTHYIVRRKGKQIRPMLVFLSAGLAGKIVEATYRSAASIELMHTATLVHDDVVDSSDLRRGFFSINALWKNKIAVLVGDYLLSKALLICVDNKEFHQLEIISKAIKNMSEGELLQIEKAKKLDITEDVYFQIIKQKTAVLIAACCSSGFSTASDDLELEEKMWLFGETVGIAFQIKDDLFDYEDTGKIGKPTGIDIKEKKMTLPLIYALSKASPKERKEMISIIKYHNTKKKKVKELISKVKALGGLDYAILKMKEYQQKALEILSDFPDSDYKVSLVEMVNYVIERKK